MSLVHARRTLELIAVSAAFGALLAVLAILPAVTARRRALDDCARTLDEVLDRSERVMLASSSLAGLVEERLGHPVAKYHPVAPPGEALPTWTPMREDGLVAIEGTDGEMSPTWPPGMFDGTSGP